jgi:hypothetical protein
MSTSTTQAGDVAQLAARAFIYAYPLEYALREIAGIESGGGTLPVGGIWNELHHARELLGTETKFVSPNNDTLYTVAPLDLRGGPLRLDVPEMGDRYYVLQLVDAWTNNFAYVGTRTTGGKAASFLLAPPGYDGDVPDGATLIVAPTGVAIIVGRIQVDGEADLAAVRALQDRFSLRAVADAPTAPAGVPTGDPAVPESLRWWERVRVALAAFPPPAEDQPILQAAAALGLTDSHSPYVDADPGLAEALVAGEAQGRATIEQLIKSGKPHPSGWTSAMHYFDYNRFAFGFGTIDAPEWKIADPETAFATRAVAARAGLFGNHGYEADYEFVFTDHDGQPLHGDHAYELRLTETPPVDAFWSLTMYGVPEFLFVANPIDRYSIGDRTPGLITGDDGSLTIYLQTDSPGPEKAANWLPTPAGAFRPMMRMYAPGAAVLEGSYARPAIRRVDGGS